MELFEFDSLPPGFLEAEHHELDSILPGPSLIKIPGEDSSFLFLATLLHGNEPTGLQAIQKLLKKYEGQTLPRGLILLIGNVKAARDNLRRFPEEPDYNRIWQGGNGPEGKWAEKILDRLKQENLIAGIDIHNTSGKNPHYACINRLSSPFVNLAKMFSQTLVYFTSPKEVLSNALAEFCTAITIESGVPGDPYGVQHVYEFLEKCFQLKQIPSTGCDDLYVYHSVARILVPEKSRIGFDPNATGKDFCFIANLDVQNFSELPENSLLGWRYNSGLALSVVDENNQDVAKTYLSYEGNEIRFKRSVVPSMFTTQEKIVHQDCLGYLMERFEIPDSDAV